MTAPSSGRSWRTLVWTAVGVFFHYTLGLALAVMLNRRLALRGIYRVVLVLPWAVPAFVTALAWRFLFNPSNGGINKMIAAVTPWEGPAWLAEPGWALVSVIATNVWLGMARGGVVMAVTGTSARPDRAVGVGAAVPPGHGRRPRDEQRTLAVGMQSFVTQYETNWGAMAAAAVLVTIPAAVVVMFAQRHLVAGLTAGGAKG